MPSREQAAKVMHASAMASGLVTTTRQLLDGHPHPAAIAEVIAAALVLTAVFAPLSGYLYRRDPATRT